jgi:hypothetical protein
MGFLNLSSENKLGMLKEIGYFVIFVLFNSIQFIKIK